jgi:hypothetical protein
VLPSSSSGADRNTINNTAKGGLFDYVNPIAMNSHEKTAPTNRKSVVDRELDKNMNYLDIYSSKSSFNRGNNVNPIAANVNSKLSSSPENRTGTHGTSTSDPSITYNDVNHSPVSSSAQQSPPSAGSGSSAILYSNHTPTAKVPTNDENRMNSSTVKSFVTVNLKDRSPQAAAKGVEINNPIRAGSDTRFSRRPPDTNTNTGRVGISVSAINAIPKDPSTTLRSMLQKGDNIPRSSELSSRMEFVKSVKYAPPVDGGKVLPSTAMQKWMATKVRNSRTTASTTQPIQRDPVVPRSRVSSSESDDSSGELPPAKLNTKSPPRRSQSISVVPLHDRVSSDVSSDNDDDDDDVESARK